MRQSFISKTFSFLLAAFSVASAAWGHQGQIFVDQNRNGLWDKEEKGLSGIIVSRLGTSRAVSLGAYAFALNELDKLCKK